MKYGLIGKKLGHSFSKEIHAHLADYEYTLLELPDEAAVAAFLQKGDFCAVNVTIPYKQTVIPYLDEISPEARAIGAVNTVVNRQGRLCGYNTDYDGMKAALARLGATDLSGKCALVLGTGGTSKTARAVLSALGASQIVTVSRTPKEGTVSYEEAARDYRNADLILNTTPVGMYPETENTPISLAPFTKLSFVFDAVYNPLSSRLVSEAREKEISAAGGLYMLAAQAYRAAELFLDTSLDPRLLETAYTRVLSAKQSIVLIGMPSSGKTTVGRALAAATGRDFIDLDEEIVKAAGRDIPSIFREAGENAFRDMESDAVCAASKRSGAVIATGGGAILRKENVFRLKQNGVLVFLDRPLEALIPTADRPTARDRAAMEARYRERLPLYLAAKDIAVRVDGDPMAVVSQIRKELSL